MSTLNKDTQPLKNKSFFSLPDARRSADQSGCHLLAVARGVVACVAEAVDVNDAIDVDPVQRIRLSLAL